MIRLAILFFGIVALSPKLRSFLRARAEEALAALRGAAVLSGGASPAASLSLGVRCADAGTRERNPDPGDGLMDNFGAAELRRRRLLVHGRGKESAGTVAALFPDRLN